MEDTLLKKYTDYLDSLLKTQSEEIFTNGGKEYASQLMSRLLNNTQKEARIYCKGFREDLICEKPYWDALNNFLSDSGKKLSVLVESDDFVDARPMQLLKGKMAKRKDETVQVRMISEEDRRSIEKKFGDKDCNFAVFDGSMFRFEYDPDGFKAFGSFNAPDTCSVLTKEFDSAFANAKPLF